MKAEGKKLLQVFLLLALAVALVRLVWVFQQRRAAEEPAAARPVAALDADHYVRPRRLYLHDLESARALTEQAVWVKEGHRYTIYPHDGRRGRTDFSREAGLLAPLERLELRQVLRQPDPRGRGQQVVAVFEREGGTFALPIGTFLEGNYNIYADEIFFYDDPRELYQHWPAEVWQAVAEGRVEKGMNEMQAAFAAGMGVPERSLEADVKVVRYPRGDDPLTVVFRNGRVESISDKR